MMRMETTRCPSVTVAKATGRSGDAPKLRSDAPKLRSDACFKLVVSHCCLFQTSVFLISFGFPLMLRYAPRYCKNSHHRVFCSEILRLAFRHLVRIDLPWSVRSGYGVGKTK